MRLVGADPRRALAMTNPTAEELRELTVRLRRLRWATDVLSLIERRPGRRAAELAEEIDIPKDRFKPRVRRLKEFGLTLSLKVGYKLSPRGLRVLRHLRDESGGARAR